MTPDFRNGRIEIEVLTRDSNFVVYLHGLAVNTEKFMTRVHSLKLVEDVGQARGGT